MALSAANMPLLIQAGDLDRAGTIQCGLDCSRRNFVASVLPRRQNSLSITRAFMALGYQLLDISEPAADSMDAWMSNHSP